MDEARRAPYKHERSPASAMPPPRRPPPVDSCHDRFGERAASTARACAHHLLGCCRPCRTCISPLNQRQSRIPSRFVKRMVRTCGSAIADRGSAFRPSRTPAASALYCSGLLSVRTPLRPATVENHRHSHLQLTDQILLSPNKPARAFRISAGWTAAAVRPDLVLCGQFQKLARYVLRRRVHPRSLPGAVCA